MKIYIAGPISGIFNYREKFMAAEKELTKRGHTVLNPSFLPDGLKDYMSICKTMIDQADALYMLKNYQESIEAMEEYEYARKHKKKIFFEENYLTQPYIYNLHIPESETESLVKKLNEWNGRNRRIQVTGGK